MVKKIARRKKIKKIKKFVFTNHTISDYIFSDERILADQPIRAVTIINK